MRHNVPLMPLIKDGTSNRPPRRGPLFIHQSEFSERDIWVILEECKRLVLFLTDTISSAKGSGGRALQVGIPLLGRLHENLIFLVVLRELRVHELEKASMRRTVLLLNGENQLP